MCDTSIPTPDEDFAILLGELADTPSMRVLETLIDSGLMSLSEALAIFADDNDPEPEELAEFSPEEWRRFLTDSDLPVLEYYRETYWRDLSPQHWSQLIDAIADRTKAIARYIPGVTPEDAMVPELWKQQTTWRDWFRKALLQPPAPNRGDIDTYLENDVFAR